jgi:hypothetical protein
MPIHTTRQSLIDDLLAYGESAVADRISSISAEQMDRIADRADDYVTENPLIAKALALAAVEVLEGEPRPLARARRQFGQAHARTTDLSSTFRAWPESFWGTIMERIDRLARAPRAFQQVDPSVPAPANTKELAAMAVRLVEERLLSAGCTRVAALHLTWPINDQFYGIANLDVTRYGADGVRIDLNVGARYVPLEDLIAKLSGRRVSRRGPGSYQILMGNIVPPEDRQPGGPLGSSIGFWFQPQLDNAAIADLLVRAFERYGRPWAEARANSDALLEWRLENRWFGNGLALPVLFLLRGEHERALAVLEEIVLESPNMPGVVAEELPAFAERFRRYVSEARAAGV